MTEPEPAACGVTPPGAEGDATSARPLRPRRTERLLSLRKLAREAGVAPSTIYLIEASRVMPQPSTMRMLADVPGLRSEPSECGVAMSVRRAAPGGPAVR